MENYCSSFDVAEELKNIKSIRQLQRKKKYRRSKLDSFRAELASLYNAGASCADLEIWLRGKRFSVSRSTVHRRLRQWPEVKIRGRKNAEFQEPESTS